MRTLIIGDIHLNEESILEIKDIFSEILKIDADRIVQVGDFYDNHRPTPKELDFGTGTIKVLKDKYKDITIISGTGRHDILNNASIIQYLSWLKVNAIKGDYISNNVLYGHFMLHESKLEYGTGRCSAKDLMKYDYVILGHQHNPQKINDKIHHIGSIRYVNFNEVMDKNKHVILLEGSKLTFIPLKSPIPMIDVKTVEELDKLTEKTKVRLIINSFDYFKRIINLIPKYNNKFHTFKVKTDFQIEQKEVVTAQKLDKTFGQSLNTYLKDNKINEDIQKILKENLK